MTVETVIGVDGGASVTRAVVLDREARERGRARGGAALVERPGGIVDVEAVVAVTAAAARAAGVELPVAGLCAGLAGVGREPERKTVEAALADRRLAAVTLVVTDAEAGFFHAFGEGPGLLLIAGTGSMAWGRGEDGREARTGGWGRLLGDEGSGYDIGLQGLRAAVRSADGRGVATEILPRLLRELTLSEPGELVDWAAVAGKAAIARLAPSVCELARAGDVVAAEIVGGAVAALDRHVAALLERLGPWQEPPGLVLGGGLLAPGRPLREDVMAAAARHGCVPRAGSVDAALGAARLALRALG